MEYCAAKLKACQEWGRPATILYGASEEELIAHVEGIEDGNATFELLAGQGIINIAIDDIQDITYPAFMEVRKGVFQVVKNPGPMC